VYADNATKHSYASPIAKILAVYSAMGAFRYLGLNTMITVAAKDCVFPNEKVLIDVFNKNSICDHTHCRRYLWVSNKQKIPAAIFSHEKYFPLVSVALVMHKKNSLDIQKGRRKRKPRLHMLSSMLSPTRLQVTSSNKSSLESSEGDESSKYSKIELIYKSCEFNAIYMKHKLYTCQVVI
jgi:hypothetical protein